MGGVEEERKLGGMEQKSGRDEIWRGDRGAGWPMGRNGSRGWWKSMENNKLVAVWAKDDMKPLQKGIWRRSGKKTASNARGMERLRALLVGEKEARTAKWGSEGK